MQSAHIINLAKADSVSLVGGKAAVLGELIRSGVRVPAGFVITTADDTVTLAGIEAKILEHFDKLESPLVAVRSSGINEDGSEASWAGQFDTYLNVERVQVIEKILACMQSAGSERSSAYARQSGAASGKIAVLVQQMVQSSVSGVAFSVHPVTKDTDQIVIEAGLGLGEAIVSGEITPDTYIVSKQSKEILQKHISSQTKMLALAEDGTQWHDTAEPGTQQKLTDSQIAELTDAVRRIETHYGSPQDIEWGWADNQLYILQSRPITTLN